MCLALPAQVIQLMANDLAVVNLGGIEKTISLALVDEIQVGDYVIIHVGYALTKLNEEEAKKNLVLFAAMAETVDDSSEDGR